MRITRVLFILSLFALFSLTGCQKVTQEKSDKINPGDVIAPIIVDAPNREQTVTVIASASNPIDVYICSEEDQQEADKKAQPPKNSFAKQLGVQQETTITATAPGKKAYAVVVTGAKKPDTTYTVKLTAK